MSWLTSKVTRIHMARIECHSYYMWRLFIWFISQQLQKTAATSQLLWLPISVSMRRTYLSLWSSLENHISQDNQSCSDSFDSLVTILMLMTLTLHQNLFLSAIFLPSPVIYNSTYHISMGASISLYFLYIYGYTVLLLIHLWVLVLHSTSYTYMGVSILSYLEIWNHNIKNSIGRFFPLEWCLEVKQEW